MSSWYETESGSNRTPEQGYTATGNYSYYPLNTRNDQRQYRNAESRNEQLNTAEFQHGVTYHVRYAAPSKGLPIVGTTQEWPSSTNLTQQGYQQHSLITSKAAQNPHIVRHKTTPNSLQENNNSLVGVGKFVKEVPAQKFHVSKSDRLAQSVQSTKEPHLVSPDSTSSDRDKAESSFPLNLLSSDCLHKIHWGESKRSLLRSGQRSSRNCTEQNLNNRSQTSVPQNSSSFNSEVTPNSKNLAHTSPKLSPSTNPSRSNSSHSQCPVKANRLSNYTHNGPGQVSSNSTYNFANQSQNFGGKAHHSAAAHSQNTKGYTENLLPNFSNFIADYKNISTNEYFLNHKVSSTDTNSDKSKELENYLSNINFLKQKEHSSNKNPDLENYYYTKHNKQFDYSLLKHSDLNGYLTHSNLKNKISGSSRNSNFDIVTETSLKNKEHLWASSNSDANRDNFNKRAHDITGEANATRNNKTEVLTIKINNCKLSPSFLEDFEMSGQYPGHSRPPVGTPPPQTVWNLTMAQGQGLNIHPTALPGATLNPPGFYTHPSIARASHLPSQLTPQLAHTQAPPTWHTPTVPTKPVTPSNAPGNPLFSLQMLVDNNRQNQNQYRNSPGVQSTLDLSATSDMAEKYSRIPQDIPISLTARNVDKGSRNGNIISPPIPLNGETSSDSGISSSVPTPNSVVEPVSLSTKDITTPKISVKNFENNLKGVANLHDKVKELTMDNFAQKVINLPPSVTIERVTTEKKDPGISLKTKDSLSVIAQVPRNILPVIVNLTSKADKDVTDSPKRDPTELDRKIEECGVRSPKNPPKRGKKGVDSLLEKLEGGTKKLGSTENIGSVIVMPIEDKDACSVRSMSPDRQKSKSPSREDDVISPSFSNEDSNDNTKQRRKRKLEKPVRLSKDSKTEVEDMELEPTEPSEPRTTCEPVPEKINSVPTPKAEERIEENLPIRRRRSSEGPSTNVPLTNQRTRRKSSDDATEFSKVTSPRGVNNANPFNEVESELEKMFAGIVETETDSKKDVIKPEVPVIGDDKDIAMDTGITENDTETQATNPTDVSSTVDTKPPIKKGKKGKGRGGKRKISRSSDNIFGSSGGESPQKDIKKRRASKGSKKLEVVKKTRKNTKIDGLREMAYDSGSNASSIRSRGPVVHVEGPRDSPLSVQVVNAPPREDEEEKNKEKRKNVGNGNAGRSKRLNHQNDLDYRGKVSRAGLFSSTLSSRYDAHTTDSTWVCVFCKQGPHSVVPGDPLRPHPNLAGPHIAPGTYTVPAGVLSDLFGPYLIGKERLEDGILSADEQEIMTEQKKGGKNKRSLRHAGLADQFAAKMGKKKRNSMDGGPNTVLLTGMTQLPGDEQRWEVWLHEQCAVWAAGVYMAGGRVTGLQEAVWDAAKSVCGSCGLTGANIGCVKRGCRSVSHYPCALTKGWLLDTAQYIPKCNVHRVT